MALISQRPRDKGWGLESHAFGMLTPAANSLDLPRKRGHSGLWLGLRRETAWRSVTTKDEFGRMTPRRGSFLMSWKDHEVTSSSSHGLRTAALLRRAMIPEQFGRGTLQMENPCF